MRVWAGVGIGIAVVVLAVLFFPLVQIQRDFRLANEQVVEARARVAELEKVVSHLKAELQAANEMRTQLQSRLDEANIEIQKLRAELEKATAAKGANAPHQEGDSGLPPSDGWQPHKSGQRVAIPVHTRPNLSSPSQRQLLIYIGQVEIENSPKPLLDASH